MEDEVYTNDPHKLLEDQIIDSVLWAKSFIARVKKKPEIATDLGTMVGWFANALQVAYNNGLQTGIKRGYSDGYFEGVLDGYEDGWLSARANPGAG